MGNNPKPTGKYAVGTTTFTAKEERDEVLKPGTKRRISARVYYPVMKETVDGFEKVQYMSRDMFKGLKKAFKLDANLMHENLCKCHLAFFNAHLKNNYGTVDLKSNDVIAYFLHDSYTKRFRKMLTLEQFKDKDLARVYSEQYFDRPLSYQGMLLGLLVAQGLLVTENVPIMTLHFYAPIYMLLTVCDREPEREQEALELMEKHIRQFDKLYGRNF